MTPTLFLANFSTLRRADPAVVGTGRRWTAMAAPRRWEMGDGRVAALCPLPEDLRGVQSGRFTAEEYFERFRAGVGTRLWSLGPGLLSAHPSPNHWDRYPAPATVADGDFIGCACARDAALRGECHLFHAAPFLVRAGWRVVLHGVEWPPPA